MRGSSWRRYGIRFQTSECPFDNTVQAKIAFTRSAGFTLIEVLVALVIFSVIAVSLSQVMAESIRTQTSLEERLTANIVAEAAVDQVRVAAPWPPVGQRTERVTLGGRDWQVTATVESTAEPAMRKLTVKVARAQSGDVIRTLETWLAEVKQ
ncbi:type II secretion system minor pseudopilin GspI [Biformimicrobium ophioploci]|uniref:Type II secretion system protein I n=1 Tax=Biformimicrobium ophioploci TaxID=3036711 RepID=A0ABQ6M1P1_9GAMM|nr:type II secretion system minor pseudopilin GspI [Microbulbifer sp. NKW57]GMG88238.1 hypothetical protein MNKW57_25590 [Microbulbifer sp. NKW57]